MPSGLLSQPHLCDSEASPTVGAVGLSMAAVADPSSTKVHSGVVLHALCCEPAGHSKHLTPLLVLETNKGSGQVRQSERTASSTSRSKSTGVMLVSRGGKHFPRPGRAA